MGASFFKKLWVPTTVSSSMILANQAGIETFVAGGIGGAHRGHFGAPFIFVPKIYSFVPIMYECAFLL